MRKILIFLFFTFLNLVNSSHSLAALTATQRQAVNAFLQDNSEVLGDDGRASTLAIVAYDDAMERVAGQIRLGQTWEQYQANRRLALVMNWGRTSDEAKELILGFFNNIENLHVNVNVEIGGGNPGAQAEPDQNNNPPVIDEILANPPALDARDVANDQGDHVAIYLLNHPHFMTRYRRTLPQCDLQQFIDVLFTNTAPPVGVWQAIANFFGNLFNADGGFRQRKILWAITGNDGNSQIRKNKLFQILATYIPHRADQAHNLAAAANLLRGSNLEELDLSRALLNSSIRNVQLTEEFYHHYLSEHFAISEQVMINNLLRYSLGLSNLPQEATKAQIHKVRRHNLRWLIEGVNGQRQWFNVLRAENQPSNRRVIELRKILDIYFRDGIQAAYERLDRCVFNSTGFSSEVGAHQLAVTNISAIASLVS